ncbi:MAG TPA: hypothetical protein VF502_17605 [Stellaceae bacterium]
MPLRAFGAIMLCLVLAWCFVPFGSSTRSGSRWSYDHVVEDRDKLERARAAGRIREDPERQRLRQAVLNVGSRLEASPCDPSIKPVLVAATAALLTHMRETGDEPRESVTIDGKEVDAAPLLNDSAGDVIREAAMAGILQPEDFLSSGESALFSAVQGLGSSRVNPPAPTTLVTAGVTAGVSPAAMATTDQPESGSGGAAVVELLPCRTRAITSPGASLRSSWPSPSPSSAPAPPSSTAT